MYGSGYTGQGGAAAAYTTAVSTCSATAGGRLATFKNQYQQWVVESILFPNITAGAVDTYWVSNVQKGLQHSTTLDNTTWYWTDTFQLIGALPSANETRLYSRWGANEPQLGQAWRCAIATRGLAYDTLGPWPELERQFGNMSVWGWTIANCAAARPYICELPCEWIALLAGAQWHAVTRCWSALAESAVSTVPTAVGAFPRHVPGSISRRTDGWDGWTGVHQHACPASLHQLQLCTCVTLRHTASRGTKMTSLRPLHMLPVCFPLGAEPTHMEVAHLHHSRQAVLGHTQTKYNVNPWHACRPHHPTEAWHQ